MPILAVLKLVPLRDWLWAGLAVAGIIFYNVHVHNLEVRYAADKVAAVGAAVTDASDKLVASAAKEMNAQAAAYAANLKKVNETYAQATQASDTAHAADLQRLRQLASAGNSGSNEPLEGPAGSSSSPDTGRSSLVGLGYVSEELYSTARRQR